MSPWEATAESLIEAGWGEVSRENIPSDWQTRRPPPKKVNGPPKGSKRKPPHWRRGPGCPVGYQQDRNKWRQRRAHYLLENAVGEVLEGR